MCGIAGIYNFDKKEVRKADLKRMCDLIKHRGPDDKGTYLQNNVGLGNRRLSIIDLSAAGHQPMTDNKENLWIVYNGEVYNYIELMQELKKKGYQFKSKTDTEVILYAYQEWGESCLQKLNGMWAFAIYNSKSRELFCARDHFGIKPFYYYSDKKQFLFSSEIKPLLAKIKSAPNYELIFDYLAYGITDHTDKTFFEKINILPPGHSLKISKNKIKIKKYWQPEFTPQMPFNKKVVEEFKELFIDSVRLRLRSDVAIGTSLSGGIDSSVIAATINKLLKSDRVPAVKDIQNTFSARYKNSQHDEGQFIEEIIHNTSLTPHYVFLNEKT